MPDTTTPRPDFVQARLTAAGQTFANGGPLTITAGRSGRSYTFQGSEPVEIEKAYEWRSVFSRHTTPAGDLLLELVPDAAPANTSQPAAKSAAAPAPAAADPSVHA